MTSLEGVKVLDLSRYIAGPYCAMLLGDMGAEVVKIEPPGAGEYARCALPAIGGTSLLGGEGSLGGTLIGALIMGVLRNGLNLLGVSSFLQQIVIGVVIVVAVLVDTTLKRHRT